MGCVSAYLDLQFFSAVVSCFHCTSLVPLWLNLFPSIYSFWCSCKWNWVTSKADICTVFSGIQNVWYWIFGGRGPHSLPWHQAAAPGMQAAVLIAKQALWNGPCWLLCTLFSYPRSATFPFIPSYWALLWLLCPVGFQSSKIVNSGHFPPSLLVLPVEVPTYRASYTAMVCDILLLATVRSFFHIFGT